MSDKDFVTYEYMAKTGKAEESARLADLYEAFGWEIVSSAPSALSSVTLSLRRDKKLKHRAELRRLQGQAENVLQTIKRMNGAKTFGARVFSCIFGIIAALVLGGGMCLVMLNAGGAAGFAGGIVLGVAGIVLCCVNYPLYKKISQKNTARLMPVIEENEEKLSNLLEQGNDLLSTELI